MKFKPHGKKKWQLALDANDYGDIETYGGSAMYFAEHWAEAMEVAMAGSEAIENCADRLSHEVSSAMGRYGVTGFQYGCAVSMLSQCWLHGEALRRWHNLKTQIKHEGEKANESGGVLNPAILNLALSE